jgi:hypothetical protein
MGLGKDRPINAASRTGTRSCTDDGSRHEAPSHAW